MPRARFVCTITTWPTNRNDAFWPLLLIENNIIIFDLREQCAYRLTKLEVSQDFTIIGNLHIMNILSVKRWNWYKNMTTLNICIAILKTATLQEII